MTASSSKEGEFATSTTTLVSIRASASPSPVMVLTPEAGDAATTSWSFSRSLLTSFVPMRPLPPITTVFMSGPPANGVFDRLEDAGSAGKRPRSEEHTSELQSLMRISYADFCLKKKNILNATDPHILTATEVSQ